MRTAFGKILQLLTLFLALFEFVASASWYTASDNKRYLIETANQYNWLQASNECARRGLQLVEIDNSSKYGNFDKLLRNVLGKSHDLWLGYVDEFNTKNDKNRPFYAASTGEKIAFSNWASGEPNNEGSVEHCVQIWTNTDFKWNDKSCEVKFGFVCEEHYLTTKYLLDMGGKRETANQKNTKISSEFSTTQSEIKEINVNTRIEAYSVLVQLKESADEILADLSHSFNKVIWEKEEELAKASMEARQLIDNIHQKAEVSTSHATSTFSEVLVKNTKEIGALLVY